MDRNKVMSSVQKKAAFLKELREKVIFFLFDGKFKYKTLLEFEILLCMSIDDKSYWYCRFSRIHRYVVYWIILCCLNEMLNRLSTFCL